MTHIHVAKKILTCRLDPRTIHKEYSEDTKTALPAKWMNECCLRCCQSTSCCTFFWDAVYKQKDSYHVSASYDYHLTWQLYNNKVLPNLAMDCPQNWSQSHYKGCSNPSQSLTLNRGGVRKTNHPPNPP